jgi:hypothetical protein
MEIFINQETKVILVIQGKQKSHKKENEKNAKLTRF